MPGARSAHAAAPGTVVRMATGAALLVGVVSVLADRVRVAGGHLRLGTVVVVLAALLLAAVRARAGSAWPLPRGGGRRLACAALGLLLVDAAVVLGTALTFSPSALRSAGYAAVALTVPAASAACWWLGTVAGQGDALVLAAGAALPALASGLFEAGAAAGLALPGAEAGAAWTRAVAADVRVWEPAAGEPFRAIGLGIDPNAYALTGVVGLVVAAGAADVPRPLRVLLAAASAGTIALSGSRGAVVAAVAVLAGALAAALTGARTAAGVRAVLLCAVTVACVAVLAAATPGVAPAARVTGTVSAAAGGGTVAALTGERTPIWDRAWRAWLESPAGAFHVPERVVGRSVHNEYLERLVWGGPVMAGAFVWLLVTLASGAGPGRERVLGAALAGGWAAAALSLSPSMLPSFSMPAFFIAGWLASRPGAVFDPPAGAGATLDYRGADRPRPSR